MAFRPRQPGWSTPATPIGAPRQPGWSTPATPIEAPRYGRARKEANRRALKRSASTSLMVMRYLRWKRTPYVAPVAVLAAVGLVALVPTLSGASAPAGLPAQSAQQLVADIAGAKPH